VKLECQECHRTFFPKTTAGKRANMQDNTKVYIGFGVGALFLVITFSLMMSGEKEPEKTERAPIVEADIFTVGTHPRTAQLVKWAQAIQTENHLIITTHSDLAALATMMELESSEASVVIAGLKTHPSTQWLRDLTCSSGSLASEAAMTASSGKAIVYLLPEPGNKDYVNDDRAELELSFHMEDEQVKVESWKIVRQIRRLTPDPNRKRFFTPNKDIERAKEVTITDSAGTRKVIESEPGPVPHWKEASTQLRAKVDEVIAGVLLSASPDGPPPARFTLKIRSLEERKAAVPRALNAMYELYGDVNANKMKLSQLDRALRDWTGYANNFQVRDSGDPARDKKERESCIRQWFAFWWRYSSSELEDFFDMSDNLEEPTGGEEPPKDKNKKK